MKNMKKMKAKTGSKQDISDADAELIDNPALIDLTKKQGSIAKRLMQTNVKTIKNIAMNKLYPERKFIINMELMNGDFTTFQIFTKKNYFKYLEGSYLIDSSLKYYNLGAKAWCLDYHQGLALPVKKQIPVDDIKTAIEQSGLYEIENSTNPSALTKLLEANLGEGIAKSSQMPDFFKKIYLIVVVGTLSSVAMLVLYVIKSGMLQQINI